MPDLKQAIDSANNILLEGLKAGREIGIRECVILLHRSRNLLEWARLVTDDYEGSDAKLRETINEIDEKIRGIK